MSPRISITLPSLYPDALARALQNIDDATRNEVEVIVVSPFEFTLRSLDCGPVRWIKESKSTGCNAAHMAAIGVAQGEFVTAWVDDHFYADGWDVLALADFEDRERKFHTIGGADKPYELGLRHVWPTHVGTEFGIYYPYFPFMRRDDVVRVGWLTDEYRQGFADSDLAMRVWAAGGRCEWSAQSLVCVHADDARKNGVVFAPQDMVLFIERWAPAYGKGWDISHLRGFNNDITPERFPQFVDKSGRSIYFNNPEFKAVVGTGG